MRSGPRFTRGGRRKVNSLSHVLPDAVSLLAELILWQTVTSRANSGEGPKKITNPHPLPLIARNKKVLRPFARNLFPG